MDNDQLAYVFMMLAFLALVGAGSGGTLLILWVMKKAGRK